LSVSNVDQIGKHTHIGECV